jgi:prepilin-type N-terminal cleavage/methylation domain-containing protein
MTPVMDARSPRHARSERGFALIEVIVSAAVLALVALAVLSGVDGANSASGREKARSVAASLAERDQERLRSMPVEALAVYGAPAAQVLNVGGANYNIASKVEWVRDSTGGTVSCANDDKQADYLHITSTVTSNIVGSRTKPVQIDSIVPPNIEYSATHGSLAVKVVNAAGQGVPGIPVALTGDSAVPAKDTNDQGCALFHMIEIGDYTVTLNGPGMVDHAGDPQATRTATVSPGVLTTLSIDYDYAASVAAAILSYQPGTSTVINSAATRLSAQNGDDITILRNEPKSGPLATPAAGITMSGLFPFSAPYTFYTGTCRYSNPAVGIPTYYGPNPGAVAVTPGQAASVNVRQPALNLRLQYYNLISTTKQQTPNSLQVYAYPQPAAGDDCVEPRIPLTTFTPVVSSTNIYGTVGRSKPNTAYVEAGLPFGDYAFCFERNVTSGSPTGISYSVWPTDYGSTNPYDLRTTAAGPTGRTTLDGSASTKWHTSGGSGTGGRQCPTTLVLP